jgi:hypothetical protein
MLASERAAKVTPFQDWVPTRSVAILKSSNGVAPWWLCVLWMRRELVFKKPTDLALAIDQLAIRPPARPEEFEPGLAHHAFLSCPGTTGVQATSLIRPS